jgi:hypothetical protein
MGSFITSARLTLKAKPKYSLIPAYLTETKHGKSEHQVKSGTYTHTKKLY